MKVTITHEVVADALRDLKTKSAARCCIVWQLCKRAGIPVYHCAFDHIMLESSSRLELPLSAQKITELSSKEWPQCVGREIEIPDYTP